MAKVAELRELAIDDLRQREHDLEETIFRMKLQKSLGQLDAPLKLRVTRRELARVKTLIGEKAATSGEINA
jgi:large subunit ribosomal protein L29